MNKSLLFQVRVKYHEEKVEHQEANDHQSEHFGCSLSTEIHKCESHLFLVNLQYSNQRLLESVGSEANQKIEQLACYRTCACHDTISQ